MTTIDNSKIFLGGVYGDATVKVAASTTLNEGTVLGLNSDGDIVAYSTDLNVDYTPAEGSTAAVEAFIAEPTYVLAQKLVNSTGSAVFKSLVRVFECGTVNIDKLVFTKEADETDKAVLAKMKNNGFTLVKVQEYV